MIPNIVAFHVAVVVTPSSSSPLCCCLYVSSYEGNDRKETGSSMRNRVGDGVGAWPVGGIDGLAASASSTHPDVCFPYSCSITRQMNPSLSHACPKIHGHSRWHKTSWHELSNTAASKNPFGHNALTRYSNNDSHTIQPIISFNFNALWALNQVAALRRFPSHEQKVFKFSRIKVCKKEKCIF